MDVLREKRGFSSYALIKYRSGSYFQSLVALAEKKASINVTGKSPFSVLAQG